jgi:hypothetical protein
MSDVDIEEIIRRRIREKKEKLLKQLERELQSTHQSK